MRRWKDAARSIGFGFAILAAVGCKRGGPDAAAAAQPAPAPGEVWLTPEQVEGARIRVEPLALHDVDDTILTSGTITLDDMRSAHVLSPVTGRVVRIVAAMGQRVRAGDPLAIIESPDIGSAVSDVHKAEADVLTAAHDLRRKKDLYSQKAGPQADVEAANDAYRKANAELERAKEKEKLLRLGNADVVTQRFTLTSPIDGEILYRNVNPGVEVTGMYSGGANVELFTIGELDGIWVMGDLYEMDFARVHKGAPATVTVVAYPDRVFHGIVDWVSGAVDPNTRTAKVRCTFDNPGKLLRPMMYATVQISVEQRKALAIPREALFRLGDDRVVFTQIGEERDRVRFKAQKVDVDEEEGSPWLVVKAGLPAGSRVVVKGGILLAQE